MKKKKNAISQLPGYVWTWPVQVVEVDRNENHLFVFACYIVQVPPLFVAPAP